jgi:hypothetical protein
MTNEIIASGQPRQQKALSPGVMLATSMHALPGVYAVLLGSGVSTGAGIPTGWGVIKELVRSVAAANGENPEQAQKNPESWWAEHVGTELGYSTLLAELAPTAAARQGLLARFFEPSEDDREHGSKVPSRAHEALAQLVKRGLVRVILTTNFDRLTEQALEAAGISPQVIARPEAVAGMAPLAHTPATVVKLHGDYKDLGSRNTAEELSTYPDEWNVLLRQVTDEYGLLISGWSADWDTALVDALESAPSRRYPLYWDSRSSRGESAKRLLSARAGCVVEASSADQLFGDLLASIEALDSLTEPALTTAMAVARLKRCLHDPARKIELHDLLMSYVEKISHTAQTQPTHLGQPDGQALQSIYDEYRSAALPLLLLLVTGVWHDTDGVHDQLWVDVVERLTTVRIPIRSAYHDFLDRARHYPALLALTAIGVAAVARGREPLVLRLLVEAEARDWTRGGESAPLAQALHVNRILNKQIIDSFPRWGDDFTGWLYPRATYLRRTSGRSSAPSFPTMVRMKSSYTTTSIASDWRRKRHSTLRARIGPPLVSTSVNVVGPTMKIAFRW